MSRDVIAICLCIILSITIADAIKQSCTTEEDLLKRCAEKMGLPVLSSPDMSFALTREELEKTCVELRGGIKCIENYTNVCMEKQEQVVFRKIYAGISDTVTQLCTEGAYQDKYLRHAECVKDVRPAYESCSTQYENKLKHYFSDKLKDPSTLDSDGIKSVCCSIQEYLICSKRKVEAGCGEDAAVFVNEMLKEMSYGILKNFCTEYTPQECGLTGKATTYSRNSVLLICVLGIFSIIYSL